MSKTSAQPAGDAPAAPPTFTGMAGHVAAHDFLTEAEFLRSFYSRPTSVMDEFGDNIYPYGDERVIMPAARGGRSGLPANQPKEQFPATALTDGAGNSAQDDLRARIAAARGGRRFNDYELRLAVRRIGGEGVHLTHKVVDDALAGATDNLQALTQFIDMLWGHKDSICQALTRPIPAPVQPSEV